MIPNDKYYTPFLSLWDDVQVEKSNPANRPKFLAHYTTIPTMECIIKNEEIWMSNPLFMNDFEELSFGVNAAAHQFRIHQGIKTACGNISRYEKLCAAFESRLLTVKSDNAFDTYVMSLSEHDIEKDRDGILSMWRGYGANGNGAAIVLDVGKLPFLGTSPFILSQVHYGSGEERTKWIVDKLDLFSTLLSNNSSIPEDAFPIMVGILLERIVIFSLYSKHHGFSEEKEWRLVYMRDRDGENIFVDMLSYSIGDNGVQPKLKFKTSTLERVTNEKFSFRSAVDSIILGPSISNQLAVSSVTRMFEALELENISGKVKASSTPYRSR